MIRTDFENLKVGDELTRMLGGGNGIPISVVVGYIDESIFKVGSKDGVVEWEDGWTFNKETGLEIDEDLGWDGKTKTGSFIKQ